MALVDPTGLYAVAVQRLVDVLEEEIRKVVSFRNAFEGLLGDLRTWNPMFEGLRGFSDNDPALNSWLKSLNDWLEKSNSLVQDCQAVEQGCACNSLYHIPRRRKLSGRIDIVNSQNEFKSIMDRVPILVLRKVTLSKSLPRTVTLPKREPKSHLKQVILDQLVSMEEQLEDILRMLISPASNSKWVGVWGQGGCGKTIIAKQVNNSDVVGESFLGQVFFLIVGGASNLRNLLQELCRLVECEFNEQDREEKLRSILYTALKGKKVLIILDDVWEGRILDAFDVVDGSEGSRILVTTRNKQLLEEKHAQISRADLMQHEACNKLFCNHAFGVGEECPESLRECAAEIIKLCKGLPLALAIVGSAMARKTGVQQWHYEAQTIKEKYFVREERMRGLFQYSYDQLNRVEQECFLTMLSWPEDSEIRPLMLVPWWRGEDLIGPGSHRATTNSTGWTVKI